jgi:hypothetical protein
MAQMLSPPKLKGSYAFLFFYFAPGYRAADITPIKRKVYLKRKESILIILF